MSSLYKRASPPQELALRIVEGAIAQAQHAHPEIEVAPRYRRSIAKRAVGLLSAAKWPAAVSGRPSQRADPIGRAAMHLTPRRAHQRCDYASSLGVRCELVVQRAQERQADDADLPLLGLIELCLIKCLGPLAKSGDAELFEAARALVVILGTRRKRATGSGLLPHRR